MKWFVRRGLRGWLLSSVESSEEVSLWCRRLDCLLRYPRPRWRVDELVVSDESKELEVSDDDVVVDGSRRRYFALSWRRRFCFFLACRSVSEFEDESGEMLSSSDEVMLLSDRDLARFVRSWFLVEAVASRCLDFLGFLESRCVLAPLADFSLRRRDCRASVGPVVRCPRFGLLSGETGRLPSPSLSRTRCSASWARASICEFVAVRPGGAVASAGLGFDARDGWVFL